MKSVCASLLVWLCVGAWAVGAEAAVNSKDRTNVVDASSVKGKILCGYQGWFRVPEDAANLGWIHWSRDGRRIAPETLTFEMWPDVSQYPAEALRKASGFTNAAGETMSLFTSDHPGVVDRHFEWMREYGIDGVWLQHFVVDLPGGPAQRRYPSRRRVVDYVRQSARKAGRVWALTYDVSGMPTDRIYDVLTADWRKLVDEGVTKDERYLKQNGRPALEIFGFYNHNTGSAMTAELGNRLIDFFKSPGPYQAFMIGGGDWNWRRNPDPAWHAMCRRFDGYSPWNTGNVAKDGAGVAHANTVYWIADKQECEKNGTLWLPVIYPGFSWDNLQRKAPGTTIIPRRGGQFLWEQFRAVAVVGAESVCVAMFDEVDEGTAVFKVTNQPPKQAYFVTYDGLPPDWYLRLVGEGTRLWREKRTIAPEIPLRP